MIIYKITNLVNNKIYIGQTIRTIKKRLLAHWYAAKCGKQSKTYLHKSMLKHGRTNFKIEELCKVDTLEELNELEEFLIQEFDSTNPVIGYNIKLGGNNHQRSYNEILKQKQTRRDNKTINDINRNIRKHKSNEDKVNAMWQPIIDRNNKNDELNKERILERDRRKCDNYFLYSNRKPIHIFKNTFQ